MAFQWENNPSTPLIAENLNIMSGSIDNNTGRLGLMEGDVADLKSRVNTLEGIILSDTSTNIGSIRVHDNAVLDDSNIVQGSAILANLGSIKNYPLFLVFTDTLDNPLTTPRDVKVYRDGVIVTDITGIVLATVYRFVYVEDVTFNNDTGGTIQLIDTWILYISGDSDQEILDLRNRVSSLEVITNDSGNDTPNLPLSGSLQNQININKSLIDAINAAKGTVYIGYDNLPTPRDDSYFTADNQELWASELVGEMGLNSAFFSNVNHNLPNTLTNMPLGFGAGGTISATKINNNLQHITQFKVISLDNNHWSAVFDGFAFSGWVSDTEVDVVLWSGVASPGNNITFSESANGFKQILVFIDSAQNGVKLIPKSQTSVSTITVLITTTQSAGATSIPTSWIQLNAVSGTNNTTFKYTNGIAMTHKAGTSHSDTSPRNIVKIVGIRR